MMGKALSKEEIMRMKSTILDYLNGLPDNKIPSLRQIGIALGYGRSVERMIGELRLEGILEIDRERGLFGTAKKPMPERRFDDDGAAPPPPRWIDQPGSLCAGAFAGADIGTILYVQYGFSIGDAEMYSFRGLKPRVQCRRGKNKDFGWRGVKGARPAAEAW